MDDYLNLLDMAYWEAKFAFDGVADDHVWMRPAEGLLSVGELAGHIAYWEAVRFAGEGTRWEDVSFADGNAGGPDLSRCHVQSLLVDPRFQYLPVTLKSQPSPDVASQGTGGGIVSATTQGKTEFVAPGSMDVKAEGKNIQLLGDAMTNNGS